LTNIDNEAKETQNRCYRLP